MSPIWLPDRVLQGLLKTPGPDASTAVEFAVLLFGLLLCIGSAAIFKGPGSPPVWVARAPLTVLVRACGPTPFLILLGALAAVAGQVLSSDSFAGRLPFHTTAGAILFFASYPLLASGVLFLGKRRYSKDAVLRLVVDALLILTGAATFSWYFLMGPALAQPHGSTGTVLLALAYPIMDLVLVAALLVLSARTSGSREPFYAALALGMAITVIADTVQQYESVSGVATTSLLSNGLRVLAAIGYVLAAFGLARFQLTDGARSADSMASTTGEKSLPHVWDSLLPYGLVPAGAALAFFATRTDVSSNRVQGVIAGIAGLACLGLLRQILSIHENLRLYRQVDTAFRESMAQSSDMRILNAELQRTRDELQANNRTLANMNLKLRAQATTDPLTQLPNHRTMVLTIDQEIERAQRYSRPCSMLFLDLDHFKALNDTCGHLMGDTILRELVTPISSGLRTIDTVGRWGGEEFVIVLPETELADALSVAERVREAVAKHRFSAGGGAHLTCSIGLATYPFDATSRDSLVEAADRAMYAAKRLGRNQVRTAADPSVVGFVSEVRRSGSREEVSLWGTVEALTMIVKSHDTSLDLHASDVANLSMRVAVGLGLSASEVRAVGLAARLHDIGKLSIPQAILDKAGPLSSDDWAKVMPHPSVGAEVVGRVPSLAMIAPLIRWHHERWDGTGYPDGIAGEEIPIGSRIISACDAYHAMVSSRPYRAPWDPEQALEELSDCAGTQFDPTVITALRQVLAEEAPLADQKAS